MQRLAATLFLLVLAAAHAFQALTAPRFHVASRVSQSVKSSAGDDPPMTITLTPAQVAAFGSPEVRKLEYINLREQQKLVVKYEELAAKETALQQQVASAAEALQVSAEKVNGLMLQMIETRASMTGLQASISGLEIQKADLEGAFDKAVNPPASKSSASKRVGSSSSVRTDLDPKVVAGVVAAAAAVFSYYTTTGPADMQMPKTAPVSIEKKVVTPPAAQPEGAAFKTKVGKFEKPRG